jgi:hypothetical protein
MEGEERHLERWVVVQKTAENRLVPQASFA